MLLLACCSSVVTPADLATISSSERVWHRMRYSLSPMASLAWRHASVLSLSSCNIHPVGNFHFRFSPNPVSAPLCLLAFSTIDLSTIQLST